MPSCARLLIPLNFSFGTLVADLLNYCKDSPELALLLYNCSITLLLFFSAECSWVILGLHYRAKWKACWVWHWWNMQLLCWWATQYLEFYDLLFDVNSRKHSTPSVFTFVHADPANASIITQCGGISLVIQCLSSPVRNTVSISEANDANISASRFCTCSSQANNFPLMIVWQVTYALGALYYLCNSLTKKEILKPDVVRTIREYASAGAVNTSFSNLANAFLEKHVDPWYSLRVSKGRVKLTHFMYLPYFHILDMN